MENTDYYSARKTGFGFSKRILGITPTFPELRNIL